MKFTPTVIETKWGKIDGYETPYGVIAGINPKWLDVDNGDAGYQRPFIRSWAEKIAKVWDRAKFRPINARLRDGILYITNGQHTANAAVIAGEDEVLVIINNGSPSRKREAQEFVDMQTKVKRVSPFETYRASLVSGDKDALILRKVAAELGITIGAKRAPGVLSAIRAGRDVALRGEEQLRDVLEVSLLWAVDDLDRFKYEILLGISKALDGSTKDTVLKNAKRWTAAGLYAKANADSGGRGFVTISNIAAILGKSRRRAVAPSVVRET